MRSGQVRSIQYNVLTAGQLTSYFAHIATEIKATLPWWKSRVEAVHIPFGSSGVNEFCGSRRVTCYWPGQIPARLQVKTHSSFMNTFWSNDVAVSRVLRQVIQLCLCS